MTKNISNIQDKPPITQVEYESQLASRCAAAVGKALIDLLKIATVAMVTLTTLGYGIYRHYKS